MRPVDNLVASCSIRVMIMDMTQPTLEDGPVPPMPDLRTAPPVRTAEELRQRWRAALGPGGFDTTSVWLMWFDHAGRQLPVVMPIDDLPDSLDPALVDNLLRVVAQTGEMGAASVAFALTRPGPDTVSAQDRTRINQLTAACSRASSNGVLDLDVWPMHLATANAVRALGVDDLQ